MTATQPDSDGTATQADRGLTRRGVMRRTAIGIGATATIGGGSIALDNGPVQESEAVAPLFVAGAIGAGISARWAVDKAYEVFGSDAPPEGLTADALKQQVYQTAKTRKSTNASTIVDNQNILGGVENTAYTEGKIAAIEALNAGKTEAEVLSTSEAAINTYHATLQKNVLKSWNEGMREAQSMSDLAGSHTNVDESSTIVMTSSETGAGSLSDSSYMTGETEQTLADGSTITLVRFEIGTDPRKYSPITQADADARMDVYEPSDTSSPDFSYLEADKWASVWSTMDQKFTNVANGLSTWVTNVYGDVQSGEIEISELVTPRERAAMMSEDESISNALADLIALNLPVDLEREATIHIAETGTTLRGSFALTNEADGPIESGATYDPATFDGDAYFTTDISLLEGTWSAFETGVDGGTVTLTSEPYEGMVYSVETTAGETVSVPASDWIDSGTGTWTFDASASLETSITEVASVDYFAETDETQFETIGLDSQFTVERLENKNTGEEETSATFTTTEPQDDTNYITQEEWDTLEQQNQELIDKYEESQNTGGFGFDDFDIGPIPGGGVAVGALALGAYLLGR